MSGDPETRKAFGRSGLKFVLLGTAILALSLAPSFFWTAPSFLIMTLAYIGVTAGAILIGVGASALNRSRKY